MRAMAVKGTQHRGVKAGMVALQNPKALLQDSDEDCQG